MLFALIIDALLIGGLLFAKSEKIRIDEDGVTRKNIFGSTNFPWTEIRSIKRVKFTSLGMGLNERIIVSRLKNPPHMEGRTNDTITFNFREDAYSILRLFSNFMNN